MTTKRKKRISHTPGAWCAVGAWVEHASDDVADICNCNPNAMGQAYLGRTWGEVDANVRLIAAAPTMLRILRDLLRCEDVIELISVEDRAHDLVRELDRANRVASKNPRSYELVRDDDAGDEVEQ